MNNIFREQQLNDELKRNKRDFDDVKDEVTSANNMIVELKRILTNREKENQKLLENVNQLENDVIITNVLKYGVLKYISYRNYY